MTSEVELRNLSAEDLETLFEHQRQPDANRMAAFPARSRADFMQHWKKILPDETTDKMAILYRGDLVGHIVSFDQGGVRQVGYWIGQQFWGRGIATRALALFLEHVKQRPLHAYVAKHNIASIRVLEKCGFDLIGEHTAIDEPGMLEVQELIFRLE